MDVRCEKCQTEYELDEARLKPGGVTVKCTNCGHMFKIRKRAITNVGAPPAGEQRPRPASSKPPLVDASLRSDSAIGDITTVGEAEGPTTVERQWLIRLENGDTKNCRELATLQQWIVAGVVTRESLISRTGKTWKRLGDIAELVQYFSVFDEARTTREAKPTNKPVLASTMMGLGTVKTASAAGGTILPDDDDIKSTGNFKARGSTTPPPAPKPRTPPMGVNTTKPPPTPVARAAVQTPPVPTRVVAPTPPPPAANPLAQTALAEPAAPVVRRPATQPPPPPAKKAPSIPAGNRSTAAWATEGDGPSADSVPQSGPFGGKLAAIPNEPAFASSKLGKVRTEPGDEAVFRTGQVKKLDDDDDMLPARRGSRAGMWLLIMALLVMGSAGGVIYMFVIRQDKTDQANKPPADAAKVVAVAVDAAAPVITPLIDAAVVPVSSPLDAAAAELTTDVEPRIRTAMTSLDGKDDGGSQGLRARLAAQLAQDLQDRAGLVGDKAEADKLRKEAKTIVIEAVTNAQRAYKAKSDDPAANLAMAEVLRLQGKPARDIKRYLDAARPSKDLARDVALADALLLVREGKLDDAKTALAAIDRGDGALEKSGDVRARYHLALVALLQSKPAEAKPLVEQILAAQPEHAGAHALGGKLETLVAKTDPIPPEDGKDAGVGAGSAKHPQNPDVPVVTGGTYESLLAQANKIADTNCTRALDLYGKALEQKPNGVEALTGMGYCHIESKQFSSAFSNFRAALSVSGRYEPALYGIAEAYQQQGLKDQAIKAYKDYLDVFPGTAKAQKQLDRLGASTAPPPDNGSGAGSATPPPTPPTPPPTPAPTPPAPDGAGSGSS